jgi:hypothetical protein
MKNGVFWVVTPEPHGVTTQKTPFFNYTMLRHGANGHVELRTVTKQDKEV